MANERSCGVELGSIGELFAVTTSGGGSVTVQSGDTDRSGYAVTCDCPIGGEAYFQVQDFAATGGRSADFNAATYYLRYSLKITALPAGDEVITWGTDSGVSTKFLLRATSAGAIKLADAGGTDRGTTSSVFTGWKRLEVLGGTGAGSVAWELRCNGASEASGSHGMGASNFAQWRIGPGCSGAAANAITIVFDNLRMTTSGHTGDGVILNRKPVSNGTDSGWSMVGTAGNAAEACAQIPPNTLDYITANVSGNAHTFLMQPCTSVGIGGRIHSATPWANVFEPSSVASAHQLRLRSGATTTDLSNFNASTTAAFIAQAYTTNPSGGAAWTVAGIDASEVGVEANAAVGHGCSECGQMVDFLPARSGPLARFSPVR